MATDHTPSAQSELRDDLALGVLIGYLGQWGIHLNINKEVLRPMWIKAYEVADCGMEVRKEG